MITIVSPASSRKLTVLGAVKSALELSGTTHDAILDQTIDQASAAIAANCGREFARETVKETVAGHGGVFLAVGRTPIVSITAIRECDGVVTVPASDYVVHDAAVGLIRRKTGVWLWSAAQYVGAVGRPVAGSEAAYYEVEYVGGYALPSMSGTRDLPFDIERACIELVKAWFLGRGRDPSVQSEHANDVYNATYFGGGDGSFPPLVRDILAPWRRYA